MEGELVPHILCALSFFSGVTFLTETTSQRFSSLPGSSSCSSLRFANFVAWFKSAVIAFSHCADDTWESMSSGVPMAVDLVLELSG